MVRKLFLALTLILAALCIYAKPEQTNSEEDLAKYTRFRPSYEEWMQVFTAPDGEPYAPLGELPRDYSIEQAELDGCVVFENLEIIAGQELYDQYIEKAESGEAAFMRTVSTNTFSKEPTPPAIMDTIYANSMRMSAVYYYSEEFDLGVVDVQTRRSLKDDEFDSDGRPLDPLHNNYHNDLQAAIDDGCVIVKSETNSGGVSYNSKVIAGQDKWDDFYKKVLSGTPAQVRVATSYTDFTGRDLLRVEDYLYDGEFFYNIISENNNSENRPEEVSCRYNYLMKYENTRGENGGTVYLFMWSDMFTQEQMSERNFSTLNSHPVMFGTPVYVEN